MYNSFIYYIIHITYIMHACDVYMCKYICTYITYMVYADTKISIIDNTLKDKKLYLWKNSNIIRKHSFYVYVLYIPGQCIVIPLHTYKKAKGEKVHPTLICTVSHS